MKKIILTLLLGVLAQGWLCAQPRDIAEELYRQGKFSDALIAYETRLKNAPNDPYLYYNIGNCYFKMGSTGLAVANYYRAFRLAPRDADVRHNLTLALESAGEKLVPSGVPEVLHKAFFYLSYNELKGLFAVCLWLFSSLACVWLLKRRLGRAAVFMLAALAATGAWTHMRARAEAEQLAVVALPVAEIRSGPGTNFPASANLAQGHLVTVQDTRDAWDEVIVKSQGIQGWIKADSLERI